MSVEIQSTHFATRDHVLENAYKKNQLMSVEI